MDILSELTSLKAEFEAAQTLLAEAATVKASYDATLEAKEAALKEAAEVVALKDKGIADLNLILSGKDIEIADLKAAIESLKQAETSAESKAVDMVAAQGVAPIKVEAAVEEAKPATRAEVLAQWATITNAAERAAFYTANKAVLFNK